MINQTRRSALSRIHIGDTRGGDPSGLKCIALIIGVITVLWKNRAFPR